jgi:plastocyanin
MRPVFALVLIAFTAAAPAPVTVTMKSMNFAPRKVSVSRGTTVVWRNDDQVAHTVTAADGSWTSPAIEPGKTYRKKFPTAGRFEIICSPHPTMKSTVVVK